MNRTRIETAEYTWNPVTGCDNICFEGDCYAYQMMRRFGKKWGYDWTPRLHKERLEEPLVDRIPKLIFSPSMGDLFTWSLVDLEIWAVLDMMKICDWHRFEVQTKFAPRLLNFNYPSNVWLGVSVCYKDDLIRLEYLRETDARIKYAYCEPLLHRLDMVDFSGIDWVVIGAKTGARSFQPPEEWIATLTKCARDAGARVFHKNNLKYKWSKEFPDEEWFKKRRNQDA